MQRGVLVLLQLAMPVGTVPVEPPAQERNQAGSVIVWPIWLEFRPVTVSSQMPSRNAGAAKTIIHQHDSARHHSVCSGSRSWGISSGKAALHEEIRRSVAELFDVALQSRASIAVQGAPERHPEGADGPDDG